MFRALDAASSLRWASSSSRSFLIDSMRSLWCMISSVVSSRPISARHVADRSDRQQPNAAAGISPSKATYHAESSLCLASPENRWIFPSKIMLLGAINPHLLISSLNCTSGDREFSSVRSVSGAPKILVMSTIDQNFAESTTERTL